MANSGVSNERKKELQQMDPFQKNLLKGLAYARQYQKQLAWIIGSIAVIVIVFSSVLYSFKSAETNAASQLSRVIETYNTTRDPVNGFALVENDFSAIFNKYTNTAAGKMAKIKFARICYDAGEYDKAMIYFKQALDEVNGNPAVRNMLLSSLGNTCLALDKTDMAREYFEKITQSKSNILKDEANFNLALLSETSNPEASRVFYQKIINDHADSLYFPLAQSRMNAIN